MNINGGIVLTDHQKKIIKTGNEYQRLGALMQGLKQNVGHLNQEMAKTPLGRQMMLTNQMTTHLTNLGKHTIFAKNAFTELKVALMPIGTRIVRVFSAIFGMISKGIALIINGFNWLFTNTEKTTKAMKLLKLGIIAMLTIIAVLTFPIISLVTAIALAFEDIWVAMNGGDSVISSVYNWFKEKFGSIKEFIKEAIDSVKNFFVQSWDSLCQLGEKIKEMLINIGNNIKDAFINMFKSIGDFFDRIINAIPEKIQKAKDYFKGLNPFSKDDKDNKEPNGEETNKEGSVWNLPNLGDMLSKFNLNNLMSGNNQDGQNPFAMKPVFELPPQDQIFGNTNVEKADLTSSVDGRGTVNKNSNVSIQNGAVQLNITTSKEINKDSLVDFSMEAINTAIKQSLASYEGGFDD